MIFENDNRTSKYNKPKPIEYNIDENGCWICTSHGRDRDGYSRLMINQKTTGVHRFVYARTHGSISNDVVVRHKCDNPTCINPDHMEIGIQSDNVRDSLKRNRHSLQKLTTNQVIEIKKSDAGSKELSERYGVNQDQINRIKRGDRWGWI